MLPHSPSSHAFLIPHWVMLCRSALWHSLSYPHVSSYYDIQYYDFWSLINIVSYSEGQVDTMECGADIRILELI